MYDWNMSELRVGKSHRSPEAFDFEIVLHPDHFVPVPIPAPSFHPDSWDVLRWDVQRQER